MLPRAADRAALALVCAASHEGLAAAAALRRRLARYEPPGRGEEESWPVVFDTENERLQWLRTVTTELWVRYVQALNTANVHPALYHAFDYDVHYPRGAPFAWQRANPVSREDMERMAAEVIRADKHLSRYAPHPALLLRTWWDELNGWCREYMGREANRVVDGYGYGDGGGSACCGGCPCDMCTARTTAEMVDAMTSSRGFDFSRRVVYALALLFPLSREALRCGAAEAEGDR